MSKNSRSKNQNELSPEKKLERRPLSADRLSYIAKVKNLDQTDIRVLQQMSTSSTDIKRVAKNLGLPYSTVQRRVKRILSEDFAHYRLELNYKKLGLKKGFMHLYVLDVDAYKLVNDILNMQGIINCGLHTGNSDIVATFIYQDSKELFDLIMNIKKLPGVSKVVWSEEVMLYDAVKQRQGEIIGQTEIEQESGR